MSEISDIDLVLEEVTEYLKFRYNLNEEKIQSLIESRDIKAIAEKLPTFFFSHSTKFWGEWLLRKRQ